MTNLFDIHFCLKKFHLNDFDKFVEHEQFSLKNYVGKLYFEIINLYIFFRFQWRIGYKFSTYVHHRNITDIFKGSFGCDLSTGNNCWHSRQSNSRPKQRFGNRPILATLTLFICSTLFRRICSHIFPTRKS